MRFYHLTPQFYLDYAACPEIEQKQDRPYTIAIVTACNGLQFAVPLRSHIRHPHVLWSNKANNCGLDLSKAVVITDAAKYIDTSTKVVIRGNEFNKLKGKDYILIQRLEKYVEEYKEALTKQHILINRTLCAFSTLQYFHKELGI